MIKTYLDHLSIMQDTVLWPGLQTISQNFMSVKLGFDLPEEHLWLLQVANGIEVYAGYFRLFGVDTDQTVDGLVWNEENCWKFAWNGRCEDFWCFAETAWGDQYAYRIDELKLASQPKVYRLDAFSMTPKEAFQSFSEFIGKELLRQANLPYDETIISTRSKLGPLAHSLHLLYSPSLLIGGSEETSEIRVQNARSSMIINGDIAIQIDTADTDASVISVEPYKDGMNRDRLKLNMV